jgi:hypothetical protein
MATNPLAENDLIERAKSGRSACRECGEKIASGALRYGMAIESWDEEIAHVWFHLPCGIKSERNRFQVVYEKLKDDIPELTALYEAEAKKPPKQSAGATGKYPYLEVASTGRAKCLQCSLAIAKGDERLAIEREFEVMGQSRTGPGYLHLACAPTFTQRPDIVEATRSATPGSASPAAPVVADAKKSPAPKLARAKSEEAICQAPDDPARYQVWADALVAEGDPLGELIVGSSVKGFDRLLAKHGPAVFGEQVFSEIGRGLELEWRHGVPHTARIFCVPEGDRRFTHFETLCRELFSRPAGRFLREVQVFVAYTSSREARPPPALSGLGWAIDPLIQAQLPLLETLGLGGWNEQLRPLPSATRPEVPTCELPKVAKLLADQPRLRTLRLEGTTLGFGSCALPALETLELFTDLTLEGLRSFAQSGRALSRLSLRFERTHLEPKPMVETLESFAAVQSLSLVDYSHVDAFLAQLVSSPLLPRLKSLRLEGSKLTRKSLVLAGVNARAFSHLESIELINPKLPQAALEEFRAALSRKDAPAPSVAASKLEEEIDLEWTNKLVSARAPAPVNPDWSVFAMGESWRLEEISKLRRSEHVEFSAETARLLANISRPSLPLDATVEAMRCALANSGSFFFTVTPAPWVRAYVEEGGLGFLQQLGPQAISLSQGHFEAGHRYGEPGDRLPAGLAEHFFVIQKAIWRLPEERFAKELEAATALWEGASLNDRLFLACLFPQLPGAKAELQKVVDNPENAIRVRPYAPMLLRILGSGFQQPALAISKKWGDNDANFARSAASFHNPVALNALADVLLQGFSASFENAVLKQLERAPGWVLAVWGPRYQQLTKKAQRLIDTCRANPAAVEAARSLG